MSAEIPATHATGTIYTKEHAPSWLLLAGSAGAVNAGAYVATKQFASHVTGTATMVGLEVREPVLILNYLLVLAAFVIGAMSPALFLSYQLKRRRRTTYSIPLLAVSVLLCLVALLGARGALGTIATNVDAAGDFVLLSMLALAMGIQNAAVSSSTGRAVRTTHLTGDSTDLGLELSLAITSRGDTRRDALRSALLRIGKIITFIGGGAVMYLLVTSTGFLAFLLPAACVALATWRSFRERLGEIRARSSSDQLVDARTAVADGAAPSSTSDRPQHPSSA